MYAPYEYSKINLATSSYQPNSIHVCDNEAYNFWQRALFQRIQSVFKINNIPENWKGNVEDFLEYLLIAFGYVVISESSEYGIYFSAGNLSGFNLYYQPTKAILVNPVNSLAGKELEIGVKCELLKFTPDYRGLMDIINYYSEKLALIDTSINTSLINSKIPYYLFADTKSAAESLKKMMDNANAGNPAVVANDVIKVQRPDSDELIKQLKLFSASDYITDKLLADHSTLLNNFDAEVGIPSVPFEKKERLVTDEANSRKLDATARARVWLDTLQSSCDIINAHYGLNLQPELTINEFSGEEDNSDETNAIRSGEMA